MDPLPAENPVAPVVQERKEMTVRGLLTLNGCLLLLGVLSLICATGGWGPLVLIALALVFVLANCFQFVKALWRREYGVALGYFLLAAGAAWLYASIDPPGKIGG